MPYKSEKQRKYLHAAKPEVAARFDADIKKGKTSGRAKPRVSGQRRNAKPASARGRRGR